MKLDIFGSGCINDPDGSITLVITECADPDNVTIEFTQKPEGAADPVITAMGNGQYQLQGSAAGACLAQVTCNG